jgi:two-component system, OmpR family, phosphate regulon response regulator OmpR
MTAPLPTAGAMIDALDRPAHILVVDDDDRIRDLLKRYLQARGARASAAADAAAARKLLTAFEFDLLVIDVTMPKEDGFSLAESVRKGSDVPIIMLTARGLPEDRIKGLSIGADDYMPKPFEPEELALRINAILRRASIRRAEALTEARFGPFVFHIPRGELRRDGDTIRLTEAEATLLRLLAQRNGDPITREDLARKTATAMERSIDVQVTRLRRKIEDDPRAPVWLQTVRGVGYRLAVD